MVGSLSSTFTAAMLSICLAFPGGCSTTKTANFYVLHSMENPAGEAKTRSVKQDVVIVVGPVGIPRYLDRPEIVTRISRYTLSLAEFDRWAEPLEENATRVLAENISSLLGEDRAAVVPWPTSIDAHYQVAVDLIQFDALPDGKVVLAATWTVFGDIGRKLLAARKSRFLVPVDSPGYNGIVMAESRALEALSREIAQMLKSNLNEMPPKSIPNE